MYADTHATAHLKSLLVQVKQARLPQCVNRLTWDKLLNAEDAVFVEVL